MKSDKEKQELYFAVIYRKDGIIELKPFNQKDDAVDTLQKLWLDKNLLDRVKATTVIKRDMSNFTDGLMFGCPKCYNVLENPPEPQETTSKPKSVKTTTTNKKN